MENKSIKPKLSQDQTAKQLGCSSSTLQRYRQDTNMLSPYRISSNSYKGRQTIPNTNLDDDSHRERHVKRPQMTSNDLKKPQRIEPIKPVKK